MQSWILKQYCIKHVSKLLTTDWMKEKAMLIFRQNERFRISLMTMSSHETLTCDWQSVFHQLLIFTTWNLPPEFIYIWTSFFCLYLFIVFSKNYLRKLVRVLHERESTCQKWRCSDKWGTITNWHKLKFQISEMKKNSYKFLKFKFGFK